MQAIVLGGLHQQCEVTAGGDSSPGSSHDAASASRWSELFIDGGYFLHINRACPVRSPVVPAVGAGPNASALVAARHHWTCD